MSLTFDSLEYEFDSFDAATASQQEIDCDPLMENFLVPVVSGFGVDFTSGLQMDVLQTVNAMQNIDVLIDLPRTVTTTGNTLSSSWNAPNSSTVNQLRQFIDSTVESYTHSEILNVEAHIAHIEAQSRNLELTAASGHVHQASSMSSSSPVSNSPNKFSDVNSPASTPSSSSSSTSCLSDDDSVRIVSVSNGSGNRKSSDRNNRSASATIAFKGAASASSSSSSASAANKARRSRKSAAVIAGNNITRREPLQADSPIIIINSSASSANNTPRKGLAPGAAASATTPAGLVRTRRQQLQETFRREEVVKVDLQTQEQDEDEEVDIC